MEATVAEAGRIGQAERKAPSLRSSQMSGTDPGVIAGIAAIQAVDFRGVKEASMNR